MREPALDWPPEETVRWAARRYGRRLVVSASFGNPEGTVLLHMVSQIAPWVPVAWINTGFLFPETLAFQEELRRRLGLRVVELTPRLSPAEQAACYGDALWERDPDLCCRMRKVEPLFRMLQGYDAWMTGIRRGQTEARASVQVVERHRLPAVGSSRPGWEIVKVNPLAGWSRARVWAYLEEHQLPHHPLLDQGYPSLGCVPCTHRVTPAGARVDDRSGRWSGRGKTECGLHTQTDRAAPLGDGSPGGPPGVGPGAGSLTPGSHPGPA